MQPMWVVQEMEPGGSSLVKRDLEPICGICRVLMYLPLETPSWAQDELSNHSQTKEKETFPWEIGTDGVVETFMWAERSRLRSLVWLI